MGMLARFAAAFTGVPPSPPTSGTEVYNAIARTGTGSDVTVTGVGFAPDTVWIRSRNLAGEPNQTFDRVRGDDKTIARNTISAESSFSDRKCRFGVSSDGVGIGTNNDQNSNGNTYICHFFKCAVGFFDVVLDTGTGSAHTIAHSLTVAPELIIRKSRSASTQWEVWCSGIANTEKLVFNSTAAKATDTTAWDSTTPSALSFTVGSGTNVNANNATFVSYLFATCPGVSKVGSYTGNGSSLTIDCGFSTGARFVLIKRTSSTGDWFIFDTARGIVAGNDPHISLNTTSVEVTTDDSIDPDSTGFIVNQVAATNLNVNAATYIYLAIA